MSKKRINLNADETMALIARLDRRELLDADILALKYILKNGVASLEMLLRKQKSSTIRNNFVFLWKTMRKN